MTDLQAALGLHQLARVEQNLLRREEIWHRYDEAFADLPVFLRPPPGPGTGMPVTCTRCYSTSNGSGSTRDEIHARAPPREHRTGHPLPAVHLHPYYREPFGYRPGDAPERRVDLGADRVAPLSPKLDDDDVDDVIAAVRETLESNSD